jgi:hypothetical protein
MSKLHKDLLANIGRPQVADSCFRLLTVHQNYPPHVQLPAACALFLMLCEAYGVSPQDVYDVTSKVMREQPTEGRPEEHFGAVRDYIKHELAQ